MSSWFPTRAAGLARLEDFLPRAGRAYRSGRNYDFGPENRNNVSGLSPYLRHRLLTEAEVLAAVLDRHARSSAEKFIDEVCWRSYWKGWLEQRPLVWQHYCEERDASLAALAADEALEARHLAATLGNTGIDAFDAWAEELVATGYLHNHARMWFASIWIFTLKLPWTLGADFFLRHLLDGDPASNTLSWRWVAGLHTRGKTYLAREDNIARYTDGRFPATPQLAAFADALEEAADVPAPALNLPQELEAGALASLGPGGVLLTEDDLSTDSLMPVLEAATVAGVKTLEASQYRGHSVSPLVTEFVAAACSDASTRAAMRFGVPDSGVSTEPETVLRWVREAGLRWLVVPYVTVGPLRDRLDGLHESLADLDVPLYEVVSAYDRVSWPHCRRGFFGLKKKIPEVLAAVGVTPQSFEAAS